MLNKQTHQALTAINRINGALFLQNARPILMHTAKASPPPPDLVPVRRALISVSDKTGIADFAAALQREFNIELISTGGTAKTLREAGLKVRVLSGAEEARFATFGVISGFFRPVGTVGDMGGGSLEIAEAIDDRVGDQWVSMPLGALPVEAMLTDGVSAAFRLQVLAKAG